jgi:nitrate reductase (NAD(P)H)
MNRIRLTGKHPYNVEAPLTDLWKAGFLTPQSLFYVRTHGATPHVTSTQAEEWKLKVHGLVKNEVEFSIQDLKDKFETITLPITLVCAGNRRKEQNMVAKGLGFNWGAAGVSNGLFTGVYLADVLDYCQPIKPVGAFPYKSEVTGRARHVIFEGIDELPKGKYGTSQRIQWARDRTKGMLIAWGLNGEVLSADHGYPLRLVVPGQIGGRMVKWLNRIEVSDKESQHYLHFMDNKVLPSQVTADQARKEMHWWYDEKYIINDLNVNAAITVPAHDSILDLEESNTTKIQGYAYTGGGKRVNRVEITLDEGDSWQIAEIEWPEDQYRIAPIKNHPFFGTLDISETEMSFSWCFWELTVETSALKDAGCIAVRATDEGLAAMPRDMYWNAMSMMNNWWFRVAIHQEGENARKFEHPTQAGNTSGGWMQRLNDEGLNNRYPKFAKEANADAPKITPKPKVDQNAMMQDESKKDIIIKASDLQDHANDTNPWFIVNGHVYDGTSFLEAHPGGGESITLVAGEDASEDFMAIHSMDAKAQLKDFHIGKLEEGGIIEQQEEEIDTKDGPFLHAKKWKKSKLISKKEISHDSRIFRFALDREDQEVGLPIGQHVYVKCMGRDKDGNETELIQRAYTPFSGNELKGYLDILIKVYFPTKEFPEGGKMTCALESLKVGEGCVDLKGPLGHFIYEKGSIMNVHKKPRKIKNVAMIAGGSGITPIWSTLKGLVEDVDAQDTNIWILDANRTETDILARTQLDELIENRSNIKLWHMLSSKDCGQDWKMGRGRVNIDCLKKHLPPPPKPVNEENGEMEDTIALLCGPPAMEEAVLSQLKEIGWNTEKSVVRF